MDIVPLNNSPVPKGILMAIGGHENKGEEPEKKSQQDNPNPLEILQTFVDLTGKEKGKAVIELITSASSKEDELFQDYVNVFKEIGIKKIRQIHHKTRQDLLNDNLKERIKEADAVFFAGGDQLRLTSIYGGTEFLLLLKQRYINEHFVIAGTSVGAMALSTPMIYTGNQDVQEIVGEIRITTGLEFLKDVCIDTHFTDRARFVRMAQAITTNPTCIGLGISEDTALIIRNGRETEVCGSGIIIVIDGFNITDSNILDYDKKVPLSVKNLRVHLLTRGDTFNIPQNNPPHI
ncbi:cyanophycinase [Rubrolithibacter danxiaensis]|uniref:cyanophycinase n=1 Tax=Rubrolithibacter danxiaensis TaxID=3390805 RepID=UPI003BF92452